MDKKQVIIDDISVSYIDNENEGPVLLFIHGNSSSSRAFRNQFRGTLGKNFRLIALDLPGHGETYSTSDKVPSYSLPFFAHILVKFIEELDLRSLVVVAQSFGGHVLLQSIERLPQVKGIVLFGTPPLGNPPKMEEAFKPNPHGVLFFKEKHTDEDIKNLADQFFSRDGFSAPIETLSDVQRTDSNFRVGIATQTAKLNFIDEVKVIESLSVPVAILHGRLEKLINDGYISKLTIPKLWRGEMQYLEGVGHSPHMEDPLVFNGMVEQFVTDQVFEKPEKWFEAAKHRPQQTL